MNQTQIKYARARAEAIYKRLEVELRKTHTVTPVLMSIEDKLKAIKAGEFSVAPRAEVRNANRYDSWDKFIKFHGEVKGGLSDTFAPAKAALEATYTKLIDELILGDNEQALRLLEAFEAGSAAS